MSGPLLIAHRGGAAEAPENTLAAFRRVRSLGVRWFELDVQMSRDGEPVVIHDNTVDRTTNGTGEVGSLLFEELRKLDEALPLGYLYRSDVTEFAPSTDAVRAVCPHFSTVARYAEQIERAHQLGKRVFTWTVNEETDMRRMAELGVDGIVSDRPSVLLSVLGEETL